MHLLISTRREIYTSMYSCNTVFEEEKATMSNILSTLEISNLEGLYDFMKS
jgi:hypothetical protein